jgi:hypothetical protein
MVPGDLDAQEPMDWSQIRNGVSSVNLLFVLS